jgi:hypothetical protein
MRERKDTYHGSRVYLLYIRDLIIQYLGPVDRQETFSKVPFLEKKRVKDRFYFVSRCLPTKDNPG